MTEAVSSISAGYFVDEPRPVDEQKRAAERIAREAAAMEREREEAAQKAVESLKPDQTISTVV